jgi:hypothetical protein
VLFSDELLGFLLCCTGRVVTARSVVVAVVTSVDNLLDGLRGLESTSSLYLGDHTAGPRDASRRLHSYGILLGVTCCKELPTARFAVAPVDNLRLGLSGLESRTPLLRVTPTRGLSADEWLDCLLATATFDVTSLDILREGFCGLESTSFLLFGFWDICVARRSVREALIVSSKVEEKSNRSSKLRDFFK